MSIPGKRLFLMLAILLAGVPAAHAQFAVIDVASVTQLVSQVQALEEQLATARAHLAQAQAQYESTTGGRGMEQLLSGTVRNYLPADWSGFKNALPGASGGSSALAQDLGAAINTNAVLSAPQLAALSPGANRQIQSDRQSAALLQVISHQALSVTSNRFASLQQLVDAIPRAADQKAVLDLQARIGAEAGMLQNEQTKLQVLYQSAQAEEWANEQRTRERIVAGHGQFSGRFQPAP
jgi:type IV secretion system protein VirB5